MDFYGKGTTIRMQEKEMQKIATKIQRGMLSYFVSLNMIERTSCTDKHFFQERSSERVSESNLLVFLIPLKAEE